MFPQDISILKVLAYFDLFNYPLTGEEITYYCERSLSEQECKESLNRLQQLQCLFKTDDFYSLQNDPGLAMSRKEGNRRAQQLLPVAHRISRFLYGFPFVKAIGISGSLSKNFADNNADIDFFIITSSNRLWIARTLMHFFKKLTFLVGRQHWYCMNYYVDERALTIEEQNIFTATEVITVIPVCGQQSFNRFFEANQWCSRFYPNHVQQAGIFPDKPHRPFVKKMTEAVFNHSLGNKLDRYWMEVTSRRWAKKEKKHRLNMKGDPLGLKTSMHYARPNPAYFQKKLLARYSEKLSSLETRWNIRFEPAPIFSGEK